MLAVQCPHDDAGVVFAACVDRTRDWQLRTDLLAQRPHVEARAALYLQQAELGALCDLATEEAVDIDPAELSGLYGRVMVKGGERARYLKLRGASRYNRCPSCGQRDVKTVDHYLSKNAYPELAVFPANLVPCCFECNHAKLDYRAEFAGEQLFHPYFDDWSGFRLVRATIDVGARVIPTCAIADSVGVPKAGEV
ncbi:hypothetical protein GTW51_23235 [Aurantimonas aggregata]|uniref:HNH endonuclease n=1 Tax=Aurantimonas aggregata TaxID=2047720 RepID=A0A6L9MPX8_9HYPH|nr:hypothetical protein [Aurantimonas aggregata]